MKALLIHNDNFFLDRNLFDHVNKYSGDMEIFIKGRLSKLNEIRSIFIPFSLSENYLEFVGIELAYHIRLTKELGALRFVPIIFFGEETPYLISKLSYLGRLLYTDGIYIIKESNKKVEELLKNNLKGTTEEKIIQQIEVPHPSNYASHHSVANEWSIRRWAEFLGVNQRDDFKPLLEKINSSLYYKCLLTKYPFEQIKKGQLQIEGNGKILLIDDEYKKGWQIIFKEIFKSHDFEFETLESDFEKSKDEIVNAAIAKVEEFYPDLVLLDLRLQSHEFYNVKVEDFISTDILRKINVLNKGIQVIIFTASNKVWNLQKLEELGADGFIIKESPEFNQDIKFMRENIKSFEKTVGDSLNKKYLKEMYSNKNELIERLDSLRKEKHINKDFQKEMQNLIELSFQVLTKKQTNEVFAMAYITLFNSIEIIANEFIGEKEPIEKDGVFVYDFYDGTHVNYYKWEGTYVSKGRLKRDKRNFQLPTNIKIINYAKEKTSLEDSYIHKIEALVELRHNFIHQNLINGIPVRIKKENVENLFNFIYQLIIKFNV